MDTEIAPRALWRRRLRRAGIVLVAAYAAYLLLGNLFINTSLAHSLVNRKPGKFQMEWGGGHTLWPGQVALRDVSMRGHVRNTLWSVQADAARGRIALLPLLRRTIRLPVVHADNVTGSVARADSEMPRPEHRPGGWTLWFDRIVSDSVKGGTVRDWRITGEGRAEVGFRKQFRGGPMELFASSGAFGNADVAHGDTQWLRAAAIETTFALPEHLSSDYPGLARLDLLKAGLKLAGDTVMLQTDMHGGGEFDFEALPGDGRIELDLALDGRALAPGGRMHLRAPLRAVDPDGAAHDSVLDIRLDVDQDLRLRAQLPQRPAGELELDLDLDVRMPGNTLPLDDWRARLAQATGSARAHLQLPSLRGVLALFTHADWLNLEGSGAVEADLQLANGRLAHGSRLVARNVDARADMLGVRFRGKAEARAHIELGEDGLPVSKMEVVMRKFSAAPPDTASAHYVTGENLRVDLRSDARLEHMRQTLEARLRFSDAQVPDLRLFNRHLPNDRLRFDGGSGRLGGDLQVDADGDVGEGTLRVDARQARLAVAGLALRGDLVLDGRLRRGQLQKGEFALGGTQIRLRNVAFTERGGDTRGGWWATIDIGDGRVGWKQPSHAAGRIRARLRDVGFLLAMFADRTEFPGWIGRVVDAGEARVDGRWQWQGDTLVLDRVRAANERFEVDARMKLHNGNRQGDLYAKWGVLGVGVELQGDGHRLHLRNAREWYDGRPHLLR